MKKIPLTQGRYAIVDDEYYELVMAHKWHYNATTGYAARKDWSSGKPKHILMHRLIADPPEGFEVDHINGDKLDNRRYNLRPSHRYENSWNSRGMPNTSSKYKGVSYYGGFWYVRLMLNGEQGYYGRYKDERLAARIYDRVAEGAYGDFAYLNFPDEPLMDEDEFYDYIMRPRQHSRFRGVSRNKKKRKWVAYIQHNRRYIHLGYYDEEDDAARAYNEAAAKYHGKKARFNEVNL